MEPETCLAGSFSRLTKPKINRDGGSAALKSRWAEIDQLSSAEAKEGVRLNETGFCRKVGVKAGPFRRPLFGSGAWRPALVTCQNNDD